jgi:hypothetical protein
MSKTKKLSNPFSTGGGGGHFEAHVQASFVTLMLTGGFAPCLPCWPIVEIKLQGKIDGFDTDDLIVYVENAATGEQRKLLAQVKHSVTIAEKNSVFGEVIQAAWNDFNNSEVFTRNKDAIALITGPLSAIDQHNVTWLLNQARHTKDKEEFFRNVQQANFSPPKSTEKLNVIQHHLKAANGNRDVSNDDLYSFLRHFYLLNYDLGYEFGVILSLLHSHIGQFQQQDSNRVWSRIVDVVQAWNQDAGTITLDNLPEDVRNAFRQKVVVQMPEAFKASPEKVKTDWARHSDATYLALTILVGSWNEKQQCDRETISRLLGIDYEEWLQKARAILHCQDSPLSLKNGVWKVGNRAELWNTLGSRILDQDLGTFKTLALSVLTESDPAFELPVEERWAASSHGKVLKYSRELREGIAEGLAILGSQPAACSNCSLGKVEEACVLVIRGLLTSADWVRWGSLNNLLPTLAEAAPGVFLDAVEKALRQKPCPFDELFAQEGSGITGRNYLTGLLWALEGLAWDAQYLVRVCVVLGELASHDPGGQWANRPFNSLVTILLPWLPQTLASIDKRKVAVQTILREWPHIAWKLIIQLLPGQQQTSFGSHKPKWRTTIPDDGEKRVTNEEYWQQVSFYAELAVDAAGYDTARLVALIDHFDSLPRSAFEKLLQVLASQPIAELPEGQRLPIWNHLTKLTNKHRRFSDAAWAFPDEAITRIEQVAAQLAPKSPFHFYQHLFTDRDFELYEENGDWEEQRRKLEERREAAIREIFQQDGAESVIRFAESVSSPHQVGYALGAIDNDVLEMTLLPSFLDSADSKRRALVSAFIWRRFTIKGWEWCDGMNRSDWTPEQVANFFACLPFTRGAWDRASKWLGADESRYWTITGANAYQADADLAIAVEKLIEHGRPHAAISCLDRMRHEKQPIDTNQCVRALRAAVSSSEPSSAMDAYPIIELIKFLQTEPSVNEDDLFRIEWAYLRLLERHMGAAPVTLESRLANDPEFFCEVIRLIYRSKKEDQPSREPSKESRAIATNAWRLLHGWKTPPGTQRDGTFSEDLFTSWLQRVKEACTESGHLEVALIHIGQVLIHAPTDPGGLWIHRAVADALNRDADEMRNGFRTGTYNSRGVHWVDPTGKPERELAEQFRRKAEEVENAGFHRFAVTLRSLADDYKREADRIVVEHQKEE